MLVLLWMALATVAIVVEVVATHFVLLFVALAALVAAGLAAAGAGFQLQVVVFSLCTVALPLLFRRPLLRRFVGRGIPSRADRLMGTVATVTETIDATFATGRVMADGQDWGALSSARIEVGSRCRVTGLDGILLVVEPLELRTPAGPTA
jgi:membrane protein implicated in regulation of membrane protease activity